MSSILTNAGATSALQMLRSLDSQMFGAEREVASGLRIEQASDNAAYWSIATTMRSDNGALSTVQDALGLGAAKVETAYEGIAATTDILAAFMAKVVSAQQDGIDKNKIQEELEQLKQQIVSISNSASFAGQNWLRSDMQGQASEGGAKTSVVSSFNRSEDGTVSVGTIDVDLSKLALFKNGGGGILQKEPDPDLGYGLGTIGGLLGFSTSGYGDVPGPVFDQPFTITKFDVVTVAFSVGTSNDTFVITKNVVDQALGGQIGYGFDGDIESTADWAKVLLQATFLNKAPPDILFAAQGGAPNIFFRATIPLAAELITVQPPVHTRTLPPEGIDILDIDVTDPDIDFPTITLVLDEMQQKVISAGAYLGSLRSRIALQEAFGNSLADSLDRGIGRLVDANMSEASSRLKALQVQQQLATQSLSIANSDAQNILSLFR
ncbi:flagellin [Neorhizobium galegae]|uniref:flagellin N-terminal helical domain-containing protein n=1 Tax=Neorhizobium galegae TaxID=399 RepID=UPI002101A89E|nr:flagellin [Neorhizobium galegae]MCQ1571290.1 flagellin [Neorhizobium galegae]